MATKKTASTPTASTPTAATAPAPDSKANRAAVKAKFPAHPPRAIELITEGMSRKLTKAEVGELRTFRLKKNGDVIATHTGPRERNPVNSAAVANVIEFAGLDGLTKMHARYGKGMKRAFRQYTDTLAEGSPDRLALDALGKSLFPSARRGFTKRDAQIVSKTGRVAVLVSDVAAPGATVKREVLTLPDGRRGLFVWAAGDDTAPSAAPAWAAGSASASA